LKEPGVVQLIEISMMLYISLATEVLAVIRYMITEACTQDKVKESYDKISCGIKAMYCDKISQEDAEAAARNLIGFCRMLVDYKTKKRAVQRRIK
jgi:hypothetical protein